ncbi:MAG: FadR/GntR family transcriptional regulator [Woeseiaceae bacterium]|nr:FadR/GntR family transcriptional regulator [Woeseiaceae bacterium]
MANERRLYQGVQNKLQESIRSGEYPAGGRLPPERELAERFGVSRPTIREAIIALEALGQVKVKTGSGVYVLDASANKTGLDPDVSPFELTEARALVEGEAAALAATLISDEQLAELERVLHEMADESVDGKLISELADQKFHHIISEATHNKMLAAMIDNLWHIRDNTPHIHKAYQSICETVGQTRVKEHQEIFDALKSRDAVAARAAMHAHFSRLLNKLIAADESEQIEKARKRALESRERFSLNHLVSET